ncbi:MAG TPA: hypothetical protein VNO51_02990 [Ilumatobacteraceae bacterium]|nr:hypothetical protein [Ilumatobacteraceae bacterium]
MTQPVGTRDNDPGDIATAASNGEIVPDESATAASLRRQSDEHPASDLQALSDQVKRRQADEPTGLTRTSKVRDADADDSAVHGRATTVPTTAEERAVAAAGGEPVATTDDEPPEYEGPNSL